MTFCVHGPQNFFMRLHPDYLTRLQIQRGTRRWFRRPYGSTRTWELRAAPEPTDPIVQPLHWPSQPYSSATEIIVSGKNQRLDHLPRAYIPGQVILDILPDVPP